MPLPLLPLIGAGASLLGSGMNAITQGGLNRRQQEFTLDMYNRQRMDALSDWNMMNAYNSPQQQMQRLKDAHLNPNLVYGTGTVANSSTPVRSSSPGSWNPTPINFGAGLQGAFGNYFDASIKEQQVDNLKVAKQVMEAQIPKIAADTASTVQKTAHDKYSLDLAKQLQDTVLATADQNLRNLQIKGEVTLDANERAQAMLAPNFAIALERVAQIRASAAHTQEDINRLRAVTQLVNDRDKYQLVLNAMADERIFPGDAAWLRIIDGVLKSNGYNLLKDPVGTVMGVIKDSVPKLDTSGNKAKIMHIFTDRFP